MDYFRFIVITYFGIHFSRLVIKKNIFQEILLTYNLSEEAHNYSRNIIASFYLWSNSKYILKFGAYFNRTMKKKLHMPANQNIFICLFKITPSSFVLTSNPTFHILLLPYLFFLGHLDFHLFHLISFILYQTLCYLIVKFKFEVFVKQFYRKCDKIIAKAYPFTLFYFLLEELFL